MMCHSTGVQEQQKADPASSYVQGREDKTFRVTSRCAPFLTTNRFSCFYFWCSFAVQSQPTQCPIAAGVCCSQAGKKEKIKKKVEVKFPPTIASSLSLSPCFHSVIVIFSSFPFCRRSNFTSNFLPIQLIGSCLEISAIFNKQNF